MDSWHAAHAQGVWHDSMIGAVTGVGVVVVGSRPVAAVRHLLSAADVLHARDRPGAATARAVLAALGTGPVTQVCATCGGPHGQPRVARGHVSVSYAGDLVAVAVSAGAPVGVDVELLAATAFDGFAAVALAPGEPDDARALTWARKEAVLKATGDGLRVDPRALRVDGGVVRWAGAPGPVALADLAVPPGYAGAVAVLAPGPLLLELLPHPLP